MDASTMKTDDKGAARPGTAAPRPEAGSCPT